MVSIHFHHTWFTLSIVVAIATGRSFRDKCLTYILEQGEHLIVCGVIGNREREVRVTQDGSDTDQTRTATGHNAHILPGILAVLALAVMFVIQTSDSGTQWFDTGGRAVLPRGRCDGDRRRAGKASLDIIVGFGGTLT